MFLWFVAAVAVLGVWFNIRKSVLSFWLWTFTNATWLVVDALHAIWAQAALQAIYLVLSVVGIVKWSKAGHPR